MKISPTLRRWLAAALVLAAAVFIGWRIFRDLESLRSFHWELRPWRLALSVVVLSGVLFWGVLV
ncbi:MAG: hypothetical protein ICV87_05195, partial [Gemmatimonadetes bacterium]|nr:hypothetical protein [Gemmatimonadota bacterium]